MDREITKTVLKTRASDARAIILPFVVVHAVSLIILGFGGDGLQDSGVQLALATSVTLGSLWSFMWIDDAMQDLVASLKDLGPDFAATEVGQRAEKFPIVVFRVFNFVVVAAMVATQLLAIY